MSNFSCIYILANSGNFIVCILSEQIEVIWNTITTFKLLLCHIKITSMFDCLHRRNFKLSENIKNE